jgi:tRNA (cytidine32/uridine32-2'-O)-methyltransferase
MKTMGITQLSLVKPGRLAVPEHEMAFKMAVKSWDVLSAAQQFPTLSEALRGVDLVFGTTARRGQRALQPRAAARLALQSALRGQRVAVVFGNEKTGLSQEDLQHCREGLRIPMAADQPSVNLAQACQLIAYEWFLAGLDYKRQQGLADSDELEAE